MLWKEPFKVSVSGHKLFSMVVFFLFCFSSPMWGSIQATGALMIYTAIFWLTSIFRLLCALPEFWFLVSGFACYNLHISYLPPDNLRVIQEALLKFVGPNLTCLSVLYSTRLKKRLLFLNNFSLFTAIAQKRGEKKREKRVFSVLVCPANWRTKWVKHTYLWPSLVIKCLNILLMSLLCNCRLHC